MMISGDRAGCAHVPEQPCRIHSLLRMLVLPLNLLITIPLGGADRIGQRIFRTIFRTIYFLPVVTSSVGVAVMWGYIFNTQYGLLNNVLRVLAAQPLAWLQDPTATIFGIPAAMAAVVIAYLWQDFGYNLVIFIAALQGIPDSLKDAAQVDGATSLAGVLVYHPAAAAPDNSGHIGADGDLVLSGV